VKTAVTVLSSALTAAAALPYIVDIVRGRARPRIASWSIWAVVQAIGAASGFSTWELPGACYTLLCAAGCTAVVFLGWRHGSREFGRLDAVCVTLAAEGVALLAVAAWMPRLIPMSWAVTVSVATDFLAYLPTFRHAWLRPDEEPWIPYAMFGVAAGLVLAVTDFRVVAGVIYPTYLFAADAAMVIMILASPHYQDRLVVPPGASTAPPMRLSAASAQWRPVTGKDWRQPDLGPAMPRPMPGYGGPVRVPDYGGPVRVRDHGRPVRAAEPTSW
jgi:hypothetical protein